MEYHESDWQALRRHKQLAQDVGYALDELAVGRQQYKFYGVLMRLYHEGSRQEREDDNKELAGLKCVTDFLQKIETWAGRVQSNSLSAQRNFRRRDWPDFNASEMAAIKNTYLSPHMRGVFDTLDQGVKSRRKFLKISGSIAAVTAISAYLMTPKVPEKTKEQEAEIAAQNMAQNLEYTKKNYGVNSPLSQHFYPGREQLREDFSELEKKYAAAVERAKKAREDAGQQSYGEDMHDYVSRLNDIKPFRAIISMIAIGATGAGAVRGVPALWPKTSAQKDHAQHRRMNDFLLAHIKNSATKLADGVEALLKQVVLEADKQKGKDDNRGLFS